MQSQIDNLCEINEFAAQYNNYATDSGNIKFFSHYL
jgi:hypothetical protein